MLVRYIPWKRLVLTPGHKQHQPSPSQLLPSILFVSRVPKSVTVWGLVRPKLRGKGHPSCPQT